MKIKIWNFIWLFATCVVVSCDRPTGNGAENKEEVPLITEVENPYNSEEHPWLDIYKDQVIFSPLTINVNSKGRWMGHEGELGYVELFNDRDSLLSKGIMTSKDGNWMTSGDAWFTAEIVFANVSEIRGKLVFHNNFISGEGGNKEERFELPVYFGKAFNEALSYVEKEASPMEEGEFNYHFIDLRLSPEGMVMGSLINAPYGTDGYRASFLGEHDKESGNVSGTLRRLAEGELSEEEVTYLLKEDRIEFDYTNVDGEPYAIQEVSSDDFAKLYREYEIGVIEKSLNTRERERLLGLTTLNGYGFTREGLNEANFYEKEIDLDTSWTTVEYVLYLMDPLICGTGGCTMFLLKDNGDVFSKTSVVKLPMYMRTSRIGGTCLSGNGWKDLFVWSDRSYRQLSYKGEGYSPNASMAPAMAEENLTFYPEKYYMVMDYLD